ncbi:hypothetical protein GGI19_005373, partial [Coemansia pectinata]
MTTLEQIQLERGSVVVKFGVASSSASSIRKLAHTFSTNPNESLSAIELHADFIQHCVEFGGFDAALAVFDTFSLAYGTTISNVHVIIQAQGLDEAAVRRVLRGYFSAWPIANRNGDLSATRPASPIPALFSTGSLGLMAMFGGQRGTGNYLDEAEWLLDVYRPLLLDF